VTEEDYFDLQRHRQRPFQDGSCLASLSSD
jgi:hypothetical protein